MGVVSSVVGLVTGNQSAKAQASASENASNAQIQATQMSIDQQNKMWDEVQALLKPYVDSGTQALSSQQDLLGLNGDEAQQSAINNIANSSEYKNYLQQGENSILQNASATGGLRGGNTQAALAQYAPNLLNNLVQQRYSNLGGLTQLGQNSATSTASSGMSNANTIGNLLQSQGAYQAGNYLQQGKISADKYANTGNAVSGILTGLAQGGAFGSTIKGLF